MDTIDDIELLRHTAELDLGAENAPFLPLVVEMGRETISEVGGSFGVVGGLGYFLLIA